MPERCSTTVLVAMITRFLIPILACVWYLGRGKGERKVAQEAERKPRDKEVRAKQMEGKKTKESTHCERCKDCDR